MWKARVDYDNVIVTSSPNVELFGDTFFGTSITPPWNTSPEGAWRR